MAPGKRINYQKTVSNTSTLCAPSTTTNVHSSPIIDTLDTFTCFNSGDSLDLDHPSTHVIETTDKASNSRNKRGPNRGVELEDHYRTKGKISIYIPEGLNRPVGEHHSKLSREAGIIIRNFAPMQVERWEQINATDKEILMKKLMVKMDISIDQPHVKECVLHTMGRRFSDFRSKAHKHYKKFNGGNSARQKPYKELVERPEDWLWLCNFFDSEAFKKKSESNSQNRAKLKFLHRMGTKSLIAHQYEQKLSRIELYKVEFTNKEKKWVSEECKRKYDNMIEMRQKIIDEGRIPDEAIICAEVLGETSSYIRGIGYGPKPTKKNRFVYANEHIEREVELENNLKGMQEKFEEQTKIIKSQQKAIDWLRAIAEKMGMQPPNEDGSTFSNEDNDK